MSSVSFSLDERLRELGLTDADLQTVSSAVSDRSDARDAFIELAHTGTHPARELTRNPSWLLDIVDVVSSSLTVGGVESSLDEVLAEATRVEDLYTALRITKRRESLRIFLRELRGTSVRQTTAEIAALAEGCLRVAVRYLARFQGEPELGDEFCVLGMGKLGGRELNFSSDVDLIYVCSPKAMTDSDLRMRCIALAQAVTDAFNATTEDGYVFRVDLRLRPDGTQGPLVQPSPAFCDYYLQFGRTWERSALLKARPVAGNLAIGDEALARLEPFIFRKYLDFGAIEELRAMKAKIEANAAAAAVHGEDLPEETSAVTAPTSAQAPLAERLKQKMRLGRRRRPASKPTPKPQPQARLEERDDDASGALGWDVKIGVGGIREIEFFVQALQLVHCGTQPRLRVKNTLEALDVLLWAGLVPNDAHGQLVDAYDFLRRVEHRIQMAEDRQSHRMPRTWAAFDRFAETMGLSRAQLRDALVEQRTNVRTVFERLFSADEERQSTKPTVDAGASDGLEQLTRMEAPHLTQATALAALRHSGFRRPRQVGGQLQVLREKKWGPFSEGAWGSELTLARAILANAASAPDPDQAFSHFSRFAQAVGDRPGYWRMLADNPHATRLLLQVFGSSPYLSLGLIRDPNVFERLLGVGTVAIEKTQRRMASELEGRLADIDDPEHRLGIIRRFHREETLRIGLHETGGAATITQSLEQLSLLAETIIRATLSEVYEPLRTRRRRPGSVLPSLDEMPFAVVAMGKLGGRELGFGSDLDIVFVYEEVRQWKLEHTFFARVAQRLIRTLSSASADGRMYEVDTRLRPSGNRGALVASLQAFDDYYHHDAGTWEQQALLRARPISGPSDLRAAVVQIRGEVAVDAAAGADALADIAQMRTKIDEAMYDPGSRDVKFGPGGLVDIEFAVQATQLMTKIPSAGRDPSVPDAGLRSQAIMEALRGLSAEFEVGEIVDAYAWLCRLQARLRMRADSATNVLPADDGLEIVARGMGHQGESPSEAFLAEFDQRTSVGRAFYERVLGEG